MVGKSSMVSWSGFFWTLLMEMAGSLTEICGLRCMADMLEAGVLVCNTVETELGDSSFCMTESSFCRQ